MKIKKIYSIILVILVIVTFTLTIFSFNNELRRSTYYNLIGVYKLYKFFTIRGDILSRDFESASHKILDYLNSEESGKSMEMHILPKANLYKLAKENNSKIVYSIAVNACGGDVYSEFVVFQKNEM